LFFFFSFSCFFYFLFSFCTSSFSPDARKALADAMHQAKA